MEEHILSIIGTRKFNFAIASAGSFSRRELAPYSDIDLMFITESVEGNEKDISSVVTNLWDNGIEVSHTVRDFADIQKFLVNDLHTFTQFFETRFLVGQESLYARWNETLLNSITYGVQVNLLKEFFNDISDRYEKYGDSPKTLEPNVKLSAGGLRDFQSVEWMFILKNKTLLNKQNEKPQSEEFLEMILEKDYTTANECRRLLDSYKLIISVRNLMHLISQQKNDRFEFSLQQKISHYFHKKDSLSLFMKEFFAATNVINRFTKSMISTFQEEITNPLPDSLAIQIDDDFYLKGKTIFQKVQTDLTLSDILRVFYYRGFYSAHFDEKLRSAILESVDNQDNYKAITSESSVFFREILKLPKNVGQTLSVMNELCVLGTFMPEFKELVGYLQHGVYHYYTADEHTLMTIQNIEKLEKDSSQLGRIYRNLKEKDILYLALLFHDIAKPINISGHEIIGSEMANSIMYRLGYSEEETEKVAFLVRNHLFMEQVAFRRNLNDPDTLNNFTSRFSSAEDLDLLYLVTYSDLSAVNPAIWTTWKHDLLVRALQEGICNVKRAAFR